MGILNVLTACGEITATVSANPHAHRNTSFPDVLDRMSTLVVRTGRSLAL